MNDTERMILDKLDGIAGDVADVRVDCAAMRGEVTTAVARLEGRVAVLEADRPRRRRSTDETPRAGKSRALVVGGTAAGGVGVLGLLGWLAEIIRGWVTAKS